MIDALVEKSPAQIRTYKQLLQAVGKTLDEGQRQVNAVKVETYWRTGRLIQAYLSNNPKEWGYGKHVAAQLAGDLHVEKRVFYRMFQFAEAFPTLKNWPEISWSHYVELIPLENSAMRKQFAREAEKNLWSVRRLREEVGKPKPQLEAKDPVLLPKLPDLKPGAYSVKTRSVLGGVSKPHIDFGFYLYGELPQNLQGLKEGAKVTWNRQKRIWQKENSRPRIHDYEGYVEKVVDGDTLRVLFSPEDSSLQALVYLRLSHIDAPPLKSPEGQKAQKFLEVKLKKNPKITFHTRGRDPYHRWIAQVKTEKGEFLNNLLLEKNLARRL